MSLASLPNASIPKRLKITSNETDQTSNPTVIVVPNSSLLLDYKNINQGSEKPKRHEPTILRKSPVFSSSATQGSQTFRIASAPEQHIPTNQRLRAGGASRRLSNIPEANQKRLSQSLRKSSQGPQQRELSRQMSKVPEIIQQRGSQSLQRSSVNGDGERGERPWTSGGNAFFDEGQQRGSRVPRPTSMSGMNERRSQSLRKSSILKHRLEKVSEDEGKLPKTEVS